MMDAILEVRDLRISFRTNSGAVKAVRDVGFVLHKGETLAIVGESGSGKSVTSRAIMGILAPNAIVENGSIIYDGKDLLELPEEDFHLLRGDKLSMIFQDPLSSLNPIVRVGKQMTEAMLLNNRERRRSAQKNLTRMLRLLERGIGAVKGDARGARAQVAAFAKAVEARIELRAAYEAAREGAEEALGLLEDLEIARLSAGDKAVMREIMEELAAAGAQARHEFVLAQADAQRFAALSKDLRADEGQMTAQAIAALKELFQSALAKPAPNHLRQELRAWDELGAAGFDTEAFLRDVRQAVARSDQRARERREHAVRALRAGRAVFTREKLNRALCLRTARKLTALVEAAIDPMAIRKDDAAYIFGTSLRSALRRYFAGLTANPREQRRVAREGATYERRVRAGKEAAKVVPATLVDMGAARANMLRAIDNVIASHAAQATPPDVEQLAVNMLDYLVRQSSLCVKRLTGAEAKHKALALLSEVGIPEPRRRYRQFPFELSGGMRQRIVIAIALSADPSILICDEPTTALDVTIQAQILELINKLKRERGLSIIFITHDLGVVANMADRICVMYAGKIVEYGTADDVFYEPAHPYTWALLSSMPDLDTKEKLAAIPGTPPNMIIPPPGDAFAPRNKYALEIDFEQHPPFFALSETHSAATWLLHPGAPKVEPPAIVVERIARMKRLEVAAHE